MEKFKNKSLELALKSQFRSKHGAVISYNGHIIGSGYNVNLEHNTVRQFDEYKTLHAEMVAIFRVKNKRLLKRSELFVCRLDRFGNALNSKPCRVCRKVMKSFGVSTVHYTTDAGTWETEIITD
jgi:deoxycytidylate deaminase